MLCQEKEEDEGRRKMRRRSMKKGAAILPPLLIFATTLLAQPSTGQQNYPYETGTVCCMPPPSSILSPPPTASWAHSSVPTGYLLSLYPITFSPHCTPPHSQVPPRYRPGKGEQATVLKRVADDLAQCNEPWSERGDYITAECRSLHRCGAVACMQRTHRRKQTNTCTDIHIYTYTHIHIYT